MKLTVKTNVSRECLDAFAELFRKHDEEGYGIGNDWIGCYAEEIIGDLACDNGDAPMPDGYTVTLAYILREVREVIGEMGAYALESRFHDFEFTRRTYNIKVRRLKQDVDAFIDRWSGDVAVDPRVIDTIEVEA